MDNQFIPQFQYADTSLRNPANTTIEIWEISIVTFPAQPDARVVRVETAAARRPLAGPALTTEADLAATIRRASRLFEPTR